MPYYECSNRACPNDHHRSAVCPNRRELGPWVTPEVVAATPPSPRALATAPTSVSERGGFRAVARDLAVADRGERVVVFLRALPDAVGARRLAEDLELVARVAETVGGLGSFAEVVDGGLLVRTAPSPTNHSLLSLSEALEAAEEEASLTSPDGTFAGLEGYVERRPRVGDRVVDSSGRPGGVVGDDGESLAYRLDYGDLAVVSYVDYPSRFERVLA